MSISSFILNQDLAGLLITIAVQTILISILGITVIKLLSKRSAPVRSLVCTGVITALGLVLVISMVFRLYDIAWPRPTLPDLPGGSGMNSISFSEPHILLPVETIYHTNPAPPQSSLEKEMINSETVISPSSSILGRLLILILNSMGFVWLMGFLFQLSRLGYGFVLVKRFRDSLPGVLDSSFNEMVRNVAVVFWKNHMPEIYIFSNRVPDNNWCYKTCRHHS
jgi:hypothetical protein